MKKFVLLAVAAATAFLFTARSAPADRFDHLVRGKFFAGISGDRAALDEAMKTCEDILAANPKHAEAMVWYGTGLFKRAADAFQSGAHQQGMELMTKGLAHMDKAVELAPDSPAVRVPRGATLLAASRVMPAEQGRPLLDRGLADYEQVLTIQSGRFESMGVHPRGELLFGLAEGWSRAGDAARAVSYFERIEKSLPGTPYAQRADKWLRTKSLAANETGCIGCHVSE